MWGSGKWETWSNSIAWQIFNKKIKNIYLELKLYINCIYFINCTILFYISWIWKCSYPWKVISEFKIETFTQHYVKNNSSWLTIRKIVLSQVVPLFTNISMFRKVKIVKQTSGLDTLRARAPSYLLQTPWISIIFSSLDWCRVLIQFKVVKSLFSLITKAKPVTVYRERLKKPVMGEIPF